MLSDTDDDIRSLLLEATSDLPALAPARDRTVRRAHRRIIGTLSVVAVLVGLVVGASVSVVDRFDRTVPAKTPQRASGAWIVNITTGTWTRMEGLPPACVLVQRVCGWHRDRGFGGREASLTDLRARVGRQGSPAGHP